MPPAEVGNNDVAQSFGLEQREPRVVVEAAVGADQAQAQVAREVVEQVEGEGEEVAHAAGVAGAQPELRDELCLLEHREQRVQARLQAHAGVAHAHAFLAAVLVQERGGSERSEIAKGRSLCPQGQRRRELAIEVGGVAAFAAGQPLHAPAPERPEAAQVLARAIEAGQKAREGGLAREPAHFHHLRQHRVAAQVGDARELVGPGQDAGDEAERRLHRLGGVGAGGPVRQQPGEQRAHFAQRQKAEEGRLPGMGARASAGWS